MQLIFVFATNHLFFQSYNIAWCILIGIVAGALVGKITEYYTSYDFKHVKRIAESSQMGAATNILYGISTGKFFYFWSSNSSNGSDFCVL